MRAIVCPRYGPPEVLQMAEVEAPTPKDREVRIRVRAATVTAGDCELRRSDFPLWLWPIARMGFGIRGPRRKILGQELAGEIEAVGKDVRSFQVGDEVFAATGFSLGAYAEFACLPESGVLARKPANMTFEEAAAVPIGGPTALHYLREARVQDGEKVLIIGAGGSIGTFAVQIAMAMGGEAIAVDSGGKLDMLRSLGVAHVIDHLKEDFTKRGDTYDVIFDVAGKVPLSTGLMSLKENGRYLMANPRFSHMVQGRWAPKKGSKRIFAAAGQPRAEDLLALKDLIEEGKVRTVIDRRYPLEQMVEAHRYVESGQKKGNVVITIGPS